MNNLRIRIPLYLLGFLMITIIPTIIFPFIVPRTISTAPLPYMIPIYGGIFTAYQILIFMGEKKNDKFILLKSFAIMFIAGFLMAMIPFTGFMISVNSFDYVNDLGSFITSILISSIAIIPFIFILKYIMLSTSEGNKYEEFIIRKIYLLILWNISYEIRSNYLILKKKKIKVPIVYINQKDNIKGIVFEHKKAKRNEEVIVKDFFDEVSNNDSSFIKIKSDDLACQLLDLANTFTKSILIYEIENELSIEGNEPRNISLVSFEDSSKSIKRALKEKENE